MPGGGQPLRAGQPGQPGADHDDRVVLTRSPYVRARLLRLRRTRQAEAMSAASVQGAVTERFGDGAAEAPVRERVRDLQQARAGPARRRPAGRGVGPVRGGLRRLRRPGAPGQDHDRARARGGRSDAAALRGDQPDLPGGPAGADRGRRAGAAGQLRRRAGRVRGDRRAPVPGPLPRGERVRAGHAVRQRRGPAPGPGHVRRRACGWTPTR